MRQVIILAAVIIVVSLLAGCGGPATRTVQRLPEPVVMPSGLIIQDFRIGTGDSLDRGDVITIKYSTYLDDGKKVEESNAYTFLGGLRTVIEGWDQGLASMRVGGQRKLTIPPLLAYGDTGRDPGIPPNATLISYLEVLSIAPQQSTENNVKYVDLVEGTGTTPVQNDTLVVNYTGWTESDGVKFDSSLNEGRMPFEFVFASGSVIKGMDDGVATMRVGGKRVLVIPPEMAYGDQGSGELIPPGATLIFEVELLEIKPAAT